MRDSANDAFFTAESLENLSEALVREGIQNSLDAAQRDHAGVRQVGVRIAFQPKAPPTVRNLLSRHFDPVRENFTRGLDIPTLDPLFGADTGYLVFEDFGTRGLTGDVSEYRLEYAEKNAFFSFFRAEGRSAKTGESLGRWGIGKQVFPAASRLHAMFGLTVRADSPARVLMGSSVVRTHSVDGKDFQPDAWFGCRERDDDPVQPVTTAQFIDSFADAFGLRRGSEAGLSVIVPSLDERVDTDDLRRGIVRNFFWPILLGELVVHLESPEKTWRLDAETLAAHRDLLPASEAAVLELASWASTAKPSDIVNLREGAAITPQWPQVGNQLLPEATINEIRSRLARDARIAVKIPVRVRPRFDNREEQMSCFTVYLAACRDSGHRPIFLRDGIVISDVRSPSMSGTRSLVVVDDAPLAGLLGDAEGVNHTQWQKDSPKFHKRYIYGPETIKFVSRSVYEIMQRLHAAETKGDPNLLLDIFYLPVDEGPTEPTKKPKPEKDGPVVEPPLPSPPPPKPRRFILDSVRGGFVLKPGDVRLEAFPVRVRIEAGYAVRRGNAIKRWTADDFAFIRSPLRQESADGVIVSRTDGNFLELEIRKSDFQFEVSGFDTKRDLVVRAVEPKGENETDV
ncbi:MAG TPA: hypothetical protein VN578_24035 [Candidatus Binatia bacterium]|jgi:hypothetical protein|nr:hypothetical protein [Candidatus Binatia bacterium]